MASVVMTTPNAFKAQAKKMADLVPSLDQKVSENFASPNAPATIVFDAHKGEMQTQRYVRRPLSGIALKPNTHAYLQVVKSDGSVMKVFNEIGSVNPRNAPEKPGDENKPLNEYWTDFFLQSVSESRQEKVQLMETFGDPILYVFGERPRFLQFQGYLVNSADFNWRSQFYENWDKYFRATSLVENDAQLFVGFDDIVVNGYPFAASTQQSAQDPNLIRFTFNLYVVNYTNSTMQNVGSLQKNRGKLIYRTQNQQVHISRSAEYLETGTFADPLYKDNIAGRLGAITAGPNVAWVEYWRAKLGGLNGGTTILDENGVTAKDLLFDSGLRYIKGGKTAAEYLLSFMNRKALQYAYQGVDRLATKTPGGTRGLNFYYGLIGHLYQIVATNALGMARTQVSPNNRWVNLLDNVAQLGNPYALASYMGYAGVAASSVGLYSLTDKFELANLDYDTNYGLVAKGQGQGINNAFSRRQPFESFQNPDLVNIDNTMSIDPKSVSAARPLLDGWDTPDSVFDPVVAPDARDSSDTDFVAKQKLDADAREALDIQTSEQGINHGAMSVIIDPREVEDDGSED